MSSSKEYELLRSEIINTYNHIQSIHNILYTAVGAILAFALKTEIKSCAICLLLPWLIILPLYLTMEAKHRGVAELGAYLYVFHEGDKFNWERRHHSFDKKHYKKRDWKEPKRYYALIILCGLCTFYKCLENYEAPLDIFERRIVETIYAVFCPNVFSDKFITFSVKIIVMVISNLLVAYMINKSQINYVDLRDSYIKEWKTIKIIEQTKSFQV